MTIDKDIQRIKQWIAENYPESIWKIDHFEKKQESPEINRMYVVLKDDLNLDSFIEFLENKDSMTYEELVDETGSGERAIAPMREKNNNTLVACGGPFHSGRYFSLESESPINENGEPEDSVIEENMDILFEFLS